MLYIDVLEKALEARGMMTEALANARLLFYSSRLSKSELVARQEESAYVAERISQTWRVSSKKRKRKRRRERKKERKERERKTLTLIHV